jgi:methylmalonyl-CoA/ethylmalonyl-CoA epimerase
MSDPVLHHVGYAVSSVEAGAAIFAARFDYVAVTPPIHVPLQTAMVQFLSQPGRDELIELVAPDRSESTLAAAVRGGGGLHHLCYAVDDLVTETARLEALEVGRMKLIAEAAAAVAIGGRRICWLLGQDGLLLELVERRDETDACVPGL